MPLAQSQAHILREEKYPPLKSWCGYTLAYAFKAAGMDPVHATPQFAGVQGLLDYGSYYGMSIYGDAHPRTNITKVLPAMADLREVHAARNALRRVLLWKELQAGTPLDIRRGDIVLYDFMAGGGPDHIQLVRAWYPEERVLTVIDGNGSGFVLRQMLEKQFGTQDSKLHYIPASETPTDGNKVSKAQKQRYIRELEQLEVVLPAASTGHVGITCHVLTKEGQSNALTSTGEQQKHARVFAVIRPSAMDFERHAYKNILPPNKPKLLVVPTPVPQR